MHVDVIKIGKYDPTQGGMFSRYDGYCLSTSEKIDHPLAKNACEDLASKKPIEGALFHSTLLRGIQTAMCLPKAADTTVMPLSELREVPFNLESLVSEEEFRSNGSNMVRARFAEAFVNNTLLENRQQIQDRLEAVLQLLRNTDVSTATLVSHSFLMKMLEAITSGVDIFKNPDLLATVIPAEKKTYPFGEGFQFEMDSPSSQN